MENKGVQVKRNSWDFHSLLPITQEFENKYFYNGKLGIVYSPEATLFRVWSPVAKKVEVILYASADGEEKERVLMENISPGTFEAEVEGDLDHIIYLYAITYPDDTVILTVDPYSIATTVNGEKSVVVNLHDTNPEDWQRMEPFTAPTDAIIYEASIRDFTFSSESGVHNRGKFLGMIEAGTKSPSGQATGLDYLKELGITHLQLLPMYDFQTVDERDPAASYNWGYDPQNYNVPEGSYATDPYTPKTRIREMKQMIKGLHDAGIRVIMDVVYNHVYSVAGHPFDNTAPGYFFRTNENGTMANGTGVGNDTASERKMVRKYIVESVKYWAQEYKLDGFRFDLMGIHDVETMNEIRRELDKIDPSIIIIGEGWDLMTNLPYEDKAMNKNAHKMPRIGHFNDALRLAVKGSDMYGGSDTGFVSGKSFQEQWIAINQQGGMFYPDDIAGYESPDQMVQYVEAHDNMTLYDKLIVSMPGDEEGNRVRRHMLATSLVLLSQGIPFIHSGQEFLRTKNGDPNSYKSPDEINQIDWNRKEAYQFAVDYVKGLIQLRQSEPLFRLREADEIMLHMEVLRADYYQVIWQLEDEAHLYYVGFNANGTPIHFSVEEGDYEVLVYDTKVTLENPEMWQGTDMASVEGFSTTVIRRTKGEVAE